MQVDNPRVPRGGRGVKKELSAGTVPGSAGLPARIVAPGSPTAPESKNAPSPTGRAWSGIFHQADIARQVPSRRMPDLAIHGEGVGNRASANAVGRRGHFAQGRCSPVFDPVALEENVPSGDAPARPRRPGLEFRDRGRRGCGPGFRITVAVFGPRTPRSVFGCSLCAFSCLFVAAFLFSSRSLRFNCLVALPPRFPAFQLL